jgi:hypothetical protein
MFSITRTITCCRECDHVTNSAREHNDPFTAQPLHTRWWCTHQMNKRKIISNPNIIDDSCPENKEPHND